jgi:hypothetical protein
MQHRLSLLEFVVLDMEDIKRLIRSWNGFWTSEDQGTNESVRVQVSVDDRMPGGEVTLRFYATEDVFARFLNILEQTGLKFSCEDAMPGIFKICRIEHEQW